nr:transaldolase [Quercus suber]
MDPGEARRWLPFKPQDQTSNQRLVYEQMTCPQNREMFLQAVKEYRDQGWEAVLDRMSALLCARNIDNIDGRVLLQSSAQAAYDTDKVVAHARNYAREFEKVGISKDRFCIKVPCTGPAMNASRILLNEGIRTLGQVTCQADIEQWANKHDQVPWYHADAALWPNVRDPALEHPMSPRIIQILDAYKHLREKTGQEQPMLKPARCANRCFSCLRHRQGPAMNASRILLNEGIRTLDPGCLQTSPRENWPGAADAEAGEVRKSLLFFDDGAYRTDRCITYSFKSAYEAMAMGELGCHNATIPEDIIQELSILDFASNPPAGDFSVRHTGSPSARLAHLRQFDPLAGPKWDGRLASTEVDYLADNGAALTKAIAADPVTDRGLKEALDAFVENELQSKAAIEEVMAQF